MNEMKKHKSLLSDLQIRHLQKEDFFLIKSRKHGRKTVCGGKAEPNHYKNVLKTRSQIHKGISKCHRHVILFYKVE